MNKTNKTAPYLPEGMTWPNEVPQPRIETVSVSIRKMKIVEDGKITEIIKTVDVPIIKKD